jgi:NAD(P)-dependent dehydrogenase (short-subunit alcohol dehydrogenase family)
VKGIQEKVALDTGGSSGIGQAVAIRLGEESANVAINFVGRAFSHIGLVIAAWAITQARQGAAQPAPIVVGADQAASGRR